jgi:O-antigen/teichoic acid export membrane protein
LNLTRAVAWNTAIQVVGRVVGLAVSVALTAILTRHLGLADYGQFIAASGYVAVFTVLGDAGIYLVAVRRAAQEA